MRFAVIELLYFILYSCKGRIEKGYGEFGFSDANAMADLDEYFSPSNIIYLHNFFLD